MTCQICGSAVTFKSGCSTTRCRCGLTYTRELEAKEQREPDCSICSDIGLVPAIEVRACNLYSVSYPCDCGQPAAELYKWRGEGESRREVATHRSVYRGLQFIDEWMADKWTYYARWVTVTKWPVVCEKFYGRELQDYRCAKPSALFGRIGEEPVDADVPF